MKKQRGQKYIDSRESLNKSKAYGVEEAIKSLKQAKFTNFDESLELHITLSIDPKNTYQRVRFNTSLPHGTGKTIKVLVISESKEKSTPSLTYKDLSAVTDIIEGKIVPNKDFDILVTTPEHMKDMAKIAKILGPKGLMPNPKNGTVTNDIQKTVDELQKGQIEIKNQNGHAVIHLLVGKLSFEDSQLVQNINHIISVLNKNTPAKLKKKFIQKAYIAGTMTPSLRIDV